MTRAFPLAAAFALVIVSGLVHGFWTLRWETAQALQLEEALARVSKVPLKFGDWEGREIEVDASTFARAGARTYWMRQYRQRRTGAMFSVILMCGRAGPMSVHTPDVCYRGAGYELTHPARSYTFPRTQAAFWTGDFAKGLPASGGLRLFWSWSVDGRWQAPDHPRFTFRGQPALYKLYVIREGATSAEPLADDPTGAFVEDFLPVLGRALFPDQEAASAHEGDTSDQEATRD
jgi:hypothetical protein